MTTNLDLFSTFSLGKLTLNNRMVMAPMTRLRALGSIPTELMATYYSQRSSAGLIITECTMISPLSQGYLNCPGIYTQEQIEGWKLVTKAVHESGGKIFLQLWHSGRVAHSALLNGELPIAPSAITQCQPLADRWSRTTSYSHWQSRSGNTPCSSNRGNFCNS